MTTVRIEVDADAIAREVGSLRAEDLDALPFGAIQLAADGTILAYNRAEESLSGRRAVEVVGRNFFHEVAPCTRVRQFYGAFQEGLARRSLNEVFDFTFEFPTGARDVRIRMIYSGAAVWIFVTPM